MKKIRSDEECYVQIQQVPRVETNLPCVFPFTYKGVTYNTCTSVDHPEEYEWCSTKIDKNGNHVTEGVNWGVCRGDSCPRNQTCPSTWTQLELGCYKILEDAMTKETAEEQCRLLGGYLVDITSKTELNTLNDWYKESIQSSCLYIADYLWVGISRHTVDGPWLSDFTGEEITYNNWLATEPNNDGGDETTLMEACAAIIANSHFSNDFKLKQFGWKDINCETEITDWSYFNGNGQGGWQFKARGLCERESTLANKPKTSMQEKAFGSDGCLSGSNPFNKVTKTDKKGSLFLQVLRKLIPVVICLYIFPQHTEKQKGIV